MVVAVYICGVVDEKVVERLEVVLEHQDHATREMGWRPGPDAEDRGVVLHHPLSEAAV